MKNKLLSWLPYLLLCSTLFVVYKNWFLEKAIIGGDWPYYFPQILKDFGMPPFAWVSWRGNGFGGIDVAYALHIFEHFTVLFTTFFGIPWNIVSKVTWFGLFLLTAAFTTVFLHKTIFPRLGIWERALAALFYCVNTYILLVTSGGQMGYALGYALSPLVVGLFIKGLSLTVRREIVKNCIIAATALGVLLMIDIRVAYIVLIIIGLYYAYAFLFTNGKKIKIIGLFFIPLVLSGLLNLSWILPLLLLKQNIVSEVSSTFSSVDSLRFFSFADFSHALGLLHPNWPENIFGKVSFMKPQFLLLPLIAFMSLLFINKVTKKDAGHAQERHTILFFAFLALLGAFLAKGTNEPFGGVYTWLFQHVPGFIMFRDPTKFYTMLALSYALLISFSLSHIKDALFKKYTVLFYTIVFVLYFLLLPYAVMGQLGGTFQKHAIPKEYVELEQFIREQPEFFRMVWLPRQSRFAPSSSEHRIIEALPFYDATASAQLIVKLKQPNAQQRLADVGVKYIIVPSDTYGEIFQKDRKYNPKEYTSVVAELRKIPWLKEVKDFENIIVFQLPSYKDHFYLLTKGTVAYHTKNTTEYALNVTSEGKNTLVFSENYNPYWSATVNGKKTAVEKTKSGYMQLTIPHNGNYDIELVFEQQRYYVTGFILSIGVLSVLLGYLGMLQYKNFSHYLKNSI